MKNQSNPRSSYLSILRTAVLGAAAGLALTFLFTFLLSVLIESGTLPESASSYAVLTVIPGAFVSGLMSAKRAGRRMLFFGLLGGAVFFLLLLLLSALFLPELPLQGSVPMTLAVCLASSAIGAVFAPKR